MLSANSSVTIIILNQILYQTMLRAKIGILLFSDQVGTRVGLIGIFYWMLMRDKSKWGEGMLEDFNQEIQRKFQKQEMASSK